MNEIIAVATITILAVISPGPDFAMVTRSSYTYGVKTGLICALGIAIGVQVHVFLHYFRHYSDHYEFTHFIFSGETSWCFLFGLYRF